MYHFVHPLFLEEEWSVEKVAIKSAVVLSWSTRWLNVDDIIDLMNNAISANDIASRDASILHAGTTIAVEHERIAADGLDGVGERPLRLDDARAASDVGRNVIFDQLFELPVGFLHDPLGHFSKDFIAWHEKCETFSLEFLKCSCHVGFSHQLQELAVVGIVLEHLNECRIWR